MSESRKYMASVRQLIFSVCVAMVVSTTAISWVPPARAAESASSSDTVLLEKYARIKGELDKNQFDLPIYLESVAKGRALQGDVYGIVNYPYGCLSDTLQLPADWCNITTLHLNIKACTFRNVDDRHQLTLYSGRKYYQPPEDADELLFGFRVDTKTPEYLKISLTADKGPFFTRDYLIGLEAMALDSARTFVHLSYSYRYGMLAQVSTMTYFATVGHDKRGFSIVTTDKEGNPVYVTGVKGAVERNAVRYYLALLAYLDTLKYPASQRFDKRINEWFDLTAKYPLQLHDMDKEEYIASKKKEHRNQLKLQHEAEKQTPPRTVHSTKAP